MTQVRFDIWRAAGRGLALALLIPIAVGLAGVLLPAIGLHPGLGRFGLSWQPLRDLFADPSLPRAMRATLISGVGAAVIAVVGAFGFCAAFHDTRWFDRARASLAAALALPHASFAVGCAFLVMPSGFLARLASPEFTGWTQPPDILIVGDELGITLLVALALKEALFLVLMIIAALGQIPTGQLLQTARSFGYGKTRAWLLVVAPLVYRQVRLPIYAVIAASIGSVDMALVLGPSAPPTLSALILRWFSDFDLTMQTRAAAGAVFVIALTLAAIGVWRLAEVLLARTARHISRAGRRSGALERVAQGAGATVIGLSISASAAAVALMAAWSFAGAWPWPSAAPLAWTSAHWRSFAPDLIDLVAQTIAIAVASAAIAVILSVAALEAQSERNIKSNALVFAPLLAPQIGFLFGVQVLWSWARLDGAFWAVVWTHLLFVAPYVYLTLRDPFGALDPRLARTARSLGKTRLETLLLVKAPLLAQPLMLAAAVGVAVSVGLYVPTVVAGAGRVSTLATESLALAAGGDRRILGVVTVALAFLPFIALAGALGAGRVLARAK